MDRFMNANGALAIGLALLLVVLGGVGYMPRGWAQEPGQEEQKTDLPPVLEDPDYEKYDPILAMRDLNEALMENHGEREGYVHYDLVVYRRDKYARLVIESRESKRDIVLHVWHGGGAQTKVGKIDDTLKYATKPIDIVNHDKPEGEPINWRQLNGTLVSLGARTRNELTTRVFESKPPIVVFSDTRKGEDLAAYVMFDDGWRLYNP